MEKPLPLVGVTTYHVHAEWGPWSKRAALVPAPYFELVAEAGGRPLLLPPVAGEDGRGVAEVVDALDALVLIGGGDLDPSAYGQAPHRATSGLDPPRDTWERALVERALAADLPLLAICRGLQVLNVSLGGSLLQHLPDRLGHERHQPAPGRFGPVEVVTAPGSTTEAIFGARLVASCSHHQLIDRLAPGLAPTAWAKEDGVIEAVELSGASFVVAVQWHPEEQGDLRPFAALNAAASRGAAVAR